MSTKKENVKEKTSILYKKFNVVQGCILICLGAFVLIAGCGIISGLTDRAADKQKFQKVATSTTNDTQKSKPDPIQEEKEQEQTIVEEPPAPIPQSEPMTEEEKIQAITKDTLEGEDKRDLDCFRKADVSELPEGGWFIVIEFNASSNLTNNLIKGGIERKMAELYIALYTSDFNIQEVVVGAVLPMTDQYGNENDRIVYTTDLVKTEADKINWDADEYLLRGQILPQVWTTRLIHPEFE